jgi:hypothetical protein
MSVLLCFFMNVAMKPFKYRTSCSSIILVLVSNKPYVLYVFALIWLAFKMLTSRMYCMHLLLYHVYGWHLKWLLSNRWHLKCLQITEQYIAPYMYM